MNDFKQKLDAAISEIRACGDAVISVFLTTKDRSSLSFRRMGQPDPLDGDMYADFPIFNIMEKYGYPHSYLKYATDGSSDQKILIIDREYR
jgi:hypothetical protein